ncbi:MAG: acyl-ACP--UDP-N-acetylglucosamine O-acyltransferase [Planctomycetes bacterium]|nr:acyl-ACP--UDP-N-acetylglucosamine O-acyltransferase [Planctomycetota bacterium]
MSIHPTALVDGKAELDADVEVGPYCVIDGHVRIAAGCRLHHGVYVTGWTELGPACVLHPGVIVGHEPQDVKYHGERSYCRIGRRTVLREHVTIHRGTIPDSETVVGEECFLLAGSHVAHNCRLGRGVTLINNVLLAGHVSIEDRATLGGGAVVHQFVRIGELTMIPGNGRVSMDVPPFAMLDFVGRVVGLNRVGMRRAGMTGEERDEIRALYRTLYGSSLPFREAVDRASVQAQTPAGRRLIAFLREESRRGIAGASHGASRTPAGAHGAD